MRTKMQRNTRPGGKTAWLGLALGAGLLLAAAVPGRADNFNITNTLAPGTVSGFPTNVVAAGGVGQGTGGPIGMQNNGLAGFWFTGLPVLTNGGAASVTITLLRSQAVAPPQVTYGTNAWSNNGTVLLASDWETFSNQPVPLVLTIPVTGTNAINWQTNLPEMLVYGANWLGVGSVTVAGATLTNCACGLAKKIIPTRWP